MTLDYSQPIPTHPAKAARMRKSRRRWTIFWIILAIVLTSLFGMESIHWANFTRREFRDQKTLFGLTIFENDYALPGRPAIAGVAGSWVIVGMNPSFIYLDFAYTREGITELYLTESLATLDGLGRLSGEQKRMLEDRLWAAAAISDYHKIPEIEEEMISLQAASSSGRADSATPAPQATP